jgi:hypothetical protein
LAQLPAAALLPSRPSPARPGAELRFVIGTAGPVRLAVVGPGGRLVVTLLDRPLAAGEHRLRWDGLDGSGRPAAAGVYWLRLVSPGGVASRRLVWLR